MKILVLDRNFEGSDANSNRLESGVKQLRNAGYEVAYKPQDSIYHLSDKKLRKYNLIVVHPKWGDFSGLLMLLKDKTKDTKFLICSGWGSRVAKEPEPLDEEEDLIKDINGIYYCFSSYANEHFVNLIEKIMADE